MKIHFCDLCNESVPQVDLDSGRAIQRKGRIVCAHCDAVMSHPAPTAGVLAAVAARASANQASASSASAAGASGTSNEPAGGEAAHAPSAFADSHGGPSSTFESTSAVPAGPIPAAASSTLHPVVVRTGGGSALWVALLGLVFTAAAVWVLDDRFRTSEEHAQLLRRDVDTRRSDVEMLQRRAALTDEALRDLDRKTNGRYDSQKDRSDALALELSKLKIANEDMARHLAALEKAAAEVASRESTGQLELEKRLAEFSQRIAKGEDDARALERRLLAVELAPPPVAAAPTPVPEQPALPPWMSRVVDLKNPSSSLRWEAVTQIGDAKDVAAVPYLVPLLKDSDVIVRMAVARVLGEMQAKAAVPDLINALEDSESAMREYTYVALRQITGKDFKFEYDANEAERAKRVKAWREWWKKESETPQGS